MDFTLTERQSYWRDRVKAHIDQYVRPRMKDYYAEQATGDRWKVLNVIEEEKARAKAAGIWNLFMPPQGANPHPLTRGIWKCSIAMARQSKRSSG
jgi:acyl-CoA dehydrogenase